MKRKEIQKLVLQSLDDDDETKNVKELRSIIIRKILPIQNDEDEKSIKKKFKKIVQTLENENMITLDSNGIVKLTEKKKKRKDDTMEDSENENDTTAMKPKNKKQKTKQKKNDCSVDQSDDNEKQAQRDNDDDDDEQGNDEGDSTNKQEKEYARKHNPNNVTRLFLGNLPFTIDEATLDNFLSPKNKSVMTHVKWITDKETGKFYGSAFIEMENPYYASYAKQVKQNTPLLGRDIKINYAAAREGDVWPPKTRSVTGATDKQPAGGTGIKGMSNSKPDDCTKLFMGNLSYDIDDDAIIKFFTNGCSGDINDTDVKGVRWLHHQDSGDFKGCGYIEFWNTKACEMGATLNGKTILGRPIRLDWTD